MAAEQKQAFLELVQEHNPHADIALISKAYDLAAHAHSGQRRLSGEEYFQHVIEVAKILAGMRLDSQTICAGLLHDVIEDTTVKQKRIQQEFGNEILELIEGVTKTQTAAVGLESDDQQRAENVRKVLLATIKDIRVIMIKLADRLHNMRTLKYQTVEKQKKISQETLEIYVPIAYKLGMHRIKSELEDLCLRYLMPQVYQSLKQNISRKREEREKEVETLVQSVETILQQKHIKAEVSGRAKNFFSTYKKMRRKHLRFEDIHDLSAVRVIVESVDDCYRALSMIHGRFTLIEERFDDYIANPKPNMYQSLHTEVMVNGKPVEVQIRTREMHYVAEEGIAAHWRYKDTERDKKFDRTVAWVKQILEWRESASAKEFIENLKIDVFKDEIYVLTPKGDPIPLPEGATPVDFAYRIHTDIGNHCVQAKVNNHVVPLDYQLSSGDVVEIITRRNAQPTRNWLKSLKSGQARSKIRQALHLGGEHDPKGERMLQREYLLEKIENPGMRLKLGLDCRPEYGKPILGVKTKDGRMSVHTLSCSALDKKERKQAVVLKWTDSAHLAISRIQVEAEDRSGLFADLLHMFSDEQVKVQSINTKTVKDRFRITFEVEGEGQPTQLVNRLKQVRNVLSVSAG